MHMHIHISLWLGPHWDTCFWPHPGITPAPGRKGKYADVEEP